MTVEKTAVKTEKKWVVVTVEHLVVMMADQKEVHSDVLSDDLTVDWKAKLTNNNIR